MDQPEYTSRRKLGKKFRNGSQPRPDQTGGQNGAFLDVGQGNLRTGFKGPVPPAAVRGWHKNGAEDGIRTRDLLLGKETLYH